MKIKEFVKEHKVEIIIYGTAAAMMSGTVYIYAKLYKIEHSPSVPLAINAVPNSVKKTVDIFEKVGEETKLINSMSINSAEEFVSELNGLAAEIKDSIQCVESL